VVEEDESVADCMPPLTSATGSDDNDDGPSGEGLSGGWAATVSGVGEGFEGPSTPQPTRLDSFSKPVSAIR
jgi:hypothetical protein